MANDKYISILFPVGRLIQGSLYEPKTTDAEGNLLIVKNQKSLRFGLPKVEYYLGVAIPKTPGIAHWSHEVNPNPRIGAWGAKIASAAQTFWGDLVNQTKDFSWKVLDGDSLDYDKSTPPKRICDKPNHAGNWILTFGGEKAPKIVNSDGSAYILEKDVVKRGYYIQVNANVTTNGSSQNKGIKLYHNLVSFQYPGEEIVTALDPASIGFGGGSAPVGVIPVGIQRDSLPSISMPQPPVGLIAPPPSIIPNHGFVNQVGTPPPPTAIRMLKNGATFDNYIAAGWTEAQIVEAGLL